MSGYKDRKSGFFTALLSSLFQFYPQGEIKLVKPFSGERGQARARGKKKRKAKLRLITKAQRKANLTFQYNKRRQENRNRRTA